MIKRYWKRGDRNIQGLSWGTFRCFRQDSHNTEKKWTGRVTCACCSAELFLDVQKTTHEERSYTNGVSVCIQWVEEAGVENILRKDMTYMRYNCFEGKSGCFRWYAIDIFFRGSRL